MSGDRPLPPIGFWALILGATGFAAGFFGPMLLNPEANQGPMTGIFITGPGGAALGYVLGAVFRFLPVSNAARFRALGVTTVVFVLGTLYFCLPPPKTVGLLIDGRVSDCQRPSALVDETLAYWDGRIAGAPWAQPRPDWRRDLRRILVDGDGEGVVLTIEERRESRILMHRKPWDFHRIGTGGWLPPATSATRYFARFAAGDCAAYAAEPAPFYVPIEDPAAPGPDEWPPTTLAGVLPFATLEAVPPKYASLAGR